MEEKNQEIKKEKEEKKELIRKKEKNNKKKNVLICCIIGLICLSIFFSVIFALLNIGNEKILSGIKIMGIDIGNLSKEQAQNVIKEMTDKKISEDITLKYKDYETTINGKQLNCKFDVEKAINEAYNIGKDGNIITNNYSILSAKLFGKDIEAPFFYDEKSLNEKIKDISSKLPGAVKQSSYYMENDKLIVVRGESGIKILEEEMKEKIIDKISKNENQEDIISMPVENVEPDEINLQQIRDEIYKKPQDAYVSKNPTVVHAHVNGVDFKISIDEANKILQENKKEYTIPLKITAPAKTIKDLGEEAFPDLLATYTTRYDASNYNRANNLNLAAKKINGTIVMPDEIFSYNKVVGERTIEAGYKEAGAYSAGGVIQSVGGGICQISSTIYNTALLANLEIVDRSNHAFATSYVPASRDATVSWGYIDFKFKNTRKYPIKIVSSANNGVAKVSIYGIKEEKEYEVVIQSTVTSYIPNSVKYISDSTLKQGKEVVEQYGHEGCKSEAYRILKLNGEVISKTLLSKDTYDPMQTIIRRGTKKVESTTTKKETKTETKKQEESNKSESEKKTENNANKVE